MLGSSASSDRVFMKILVTDGDNRAALAITRSLGRKGHAVVVGSDEHPSLAARSKYCFDTVSYPSPRKHPEAFIEALIRIVRDRKIEVLLPVSDVTTIPVCERKREIEPFCAVPFSDREAIDLAADKARLFDLAHHLDVAVPRTQLIREKDELSVDSLEELGFPVVIKPGRSRVRCNDRWVSTSVQYAGSREEVESLLAMIPQEAYPVLLQERIRGPGIGVFTCYDHGRPLAFFSHRRLREKPPSGGVSVLRESIPVSPAAREFSIRLLNHMQWHGVAMVEFKLDERDNVPKLMEINGRFWGSLQLAIDAGVDFPHLLVSTVSGSPAAAEADYRVGVKTRWLLGDLDRLLLLLTKSRESLNLPVGHPGRLKCLFEFIKFFGKDLHYEVLSKDDMKPWLYEVRKWLIPDHR